MRAVANSDETLHEVTEVAVIWHRDLGVLLLHSAERRWHLPDATVRAGDRWDEALRNSVHETTGIDDLAIGPVLMIQNYDAGEVDERPQFGIFISCTTDRPETIGDRSHRWVEDRAAAEELDLFHPLIADLVARRLQGTERSDS